MTTPPSERDKMRSLSQELGKALADNIPDEVGFFLILFHAPTTWIQIASDINRVKALEILEKYSGSLRKELQDEGLIQKPN